MAGHFQIIGYTAQCVGMDRNISNLSALSVDPKVHHALPRFHVANIQGTHFSATQRVKEKNRQYRAITPAFQSLARRSTKERRGLFVGKGW